MKKLLSFSIIALLFALVSCGESKETLALKAEIEIVKKENEAYKAKTNQLSTSIDSYKKLLLEIDKNLQGIDESVTVANGLKNELTKDASLGNKVLNRIKRIYGLMENSKLKIQALDKTLNDLRKKFGDQSEVVLTLNRELKMSAQQLIEREMEFNEMKTGFENEIEGLESAYETQLKIAEDLKEMIDRAFYFAGTNGDLKSKEIIEKEGGFIGIGRVKVLNANSSEAVFAKISKEATDSLVVMSKNLKLITDHPVGSYSIKETKTKSVLIITNKKSFWKQGNYLVFQIDEPKMIEKAK